VIAGGKHLDIVFLIGCCGFSFSRLSTGVFVGLCVCVHFWVVTVCAYRVCVLSACVCRYVYVLGMYLCMCV